MPKPDLPAFEHLEALSRRLMQLGSCAISHHDFLRETVQLLLQASRCDSVDLMLGEGENSILCHGERLSGEAGNEFRVVSRRVEFHEPLFPAIGHPGLTAHVSEGNTSRLQTKVSGGGNALLIPLQVPGERVGNLSLTSAMKDHFPPETARQWEELAPVLAFSIMSQRAQWALGERIKELTCLYGLASISAQPDISLAEIMQQTVLLLPPGWQHPEITCASIRLDDKTFVTPGSRKGFYRQMAGIFVKGILRGEVQVTYLEEKPEIDEGPFLREERNLINALAAQLALIIERKEAEDESKLLQEQLRHADRLATVGQLAAGVAHELNEPLSGILGFAQLARKASKVPEQTIRDLDKIVSSTLYAREIVRQLLYFSRQMTPQKLLLNLNRLVDEALAFLEGRCAKEGIELIRESDPDLPEITADAAQIHQVLVNLVVNAIQAMSQGGKLTVRTGFDQQWVSLEVTDTGIGMSEEVQRQAFIPFFTTKDVHHGTGIGLSVVHGIIVSHGGSISVRSEPGKGATFTIRLPYQEKAEVGEFTGE